VRRLCRIPIRAYLVTDWVEGAITLEEILRRERGIGREQVNALARMLARMHNAGFSHRDLKASNVLFDSEGQPVLIDLDGVSRFRLPERERPVADLARFAWEFAKYPTTLKWAGSRFLKRYCVDRGWVTASDERRQVAREILQPTAQRLAAGVDYWKS
jgi:tRNA A-37 threonylcarbamoyl transferase component Bud32